MSDRNRNIFKVITHKSDSSPRVSGLHTLELSCDIFNASNGVGALTILRCISGDVVNFCA